MIWSSLPGIIFETRNAYSFTNSTTCLYNLISQEDVNFLLEAGRNGIQWEILAVFQSLNLVENRESWKPSLNKKYHVSWEELWKKTEVFPSKIGTSQPKCSQKSCFSVYFDLWTSRKITQRWFQSRVFQRCFCVSLSSRSDCLSVRQEQKVMEALQKSLQAAGTDGGHMTATQTSTRW